MKRKQENFHKPHSKRRKTKSSKKKRKKKVQKPNKNQKKSKGPLELSDYVLFVFKSIKGECATVMDLIPGYEILLNNGSLENNRKDQNKYKPIYNAIDRFTKNGRDYIKKIVFRQGRNNRTRFKINEKNMDEIENFITEIEIEKQVTYDEFFKDVLRKLPGKYDESESDDDDEVKKNVKKKKKKKKRKKKVIKRDEELQDDDDDDEDDDDDGPRRSRRNRRKRQPNYKEVDDEDEKDFLIDEEILPKMNKKQDNVEDDQNIYENGNDNEENVSKRYFTRSRLRSFQNISPNENDSEKHDDEEEEDEDEIDIGVEKKNLKSMNGNTIVVDEENNRRHSNVSTESEFFNVYDDDENPTVKGKDFEEEFDESINFEGDDEIGIEKKVENGNNDNIYEQNEFYNNEKRLSFQSQDSDDSKSKNIYEESDEYEKDSYSYREGIIEKEDKKVKLNELNSKHKLSNHENSLVLNGVFSEFDVSKLREFFENFSGIKQFKVFIVFIYKLCQIIEDLKESNVYQSLKIEDISFNFDFQNKDVIQYMFVNINNENYQVGSDEQQKKSSMNECFMVNIKFIQNLIKSFRDLFESNNKSSLYSSMLNDFEFNVGNDISVIITKISNEFM